MRKWFLSSLAAAGILLFASSMCTGQAMPGAQRFGGDVQAGAGLLYLRPDYLNKDNLGITGYIDYDVTPYIGVEVTGHFGGLYSPSDLSENSFLAGPRGVYRRGRLAVYAKALFGYSTIALTLKNESSGFGTYAYGGGLEFLAQRHLNIRVFDIEQQKWPDFEPHTLSPMTMTIGAAYVFR